MKDHDILSAFDTITSEADGERTVNMVRLNIETHENQRHISFLRKGFAVACIAFLLLFSVGAYSIYQSLSVKIPECGPFDYVVQVDADEDQTGSSEPEMITLSDALMTELANYRFDASSEKSIYESGKTFDSWDEAAQWLDIPLLTSPKLGGLPENVVWGGEIVLVSFYSSDGEIRCIQLTGTNDIVGEGISCQTTVTIPLSGKWEEYGVAVSLADINENGVLELSEDQASDSATVNSFTTSHGNQAQIAVVKYGNLYHATGYYMEGGIIYSYTVIHDEQLVAVDLVKLIIESLVYRKVN